MQARVSFPFCRWVRTAFTIKVSADTPINCSCYQVLYSGNDWAFVPMAKEAAAAVDTKGKCHCRKS